MKAHHVFATLAAAIVFACVCGFMATREGLSPARKQAARNGAQVYLQVCSSCHGLDYARYGDLAALGYSAKDIADLAAEFAVSAGFDDAGNPVTRPAGASDLFVKPYENEQTARYINYGALPPDLTLITRQRGKSSTYVRKLLTSYAQNGEPETPESIYYPNTAAPNGHIAMADPLFEGLVTYADGTEPAKAQMAADVARFLDFIADPVREQRRKTGWLVLGFLGLLLAVVQILTTDIWNDVRKK